jgi:hypothetical protein
MKHLIKALVLLGFAVIGGECHLLRPRRFRKKVKKAKKINKGPVQKKKSCAHFLEVGDTLKSQEENAEESTASECFPPEESDFFNVEEGIRSKLGLLHKRWHEV